MKMLKDGELYGKYRVTKLYSDKIKKINSINDHQPRCYKFSRSKTICRFKNWCDKKDYVPIGYMPWKLFACDMILQPPDLTFLEQHKNKVQEVIHIIHELKSIRDTSEREDRFEEISKTLSNSNGKIVKSRGCRKKRISETSINKMARFMI